MGGMGGMAANLEINPSHPVVTKLKEMAAGGDASGAAAQYAELLHEVAIVSSGYEIADPSAFAKRVTALMAGGEAGLAALTDEADGAAGGEAVAVAEPAAEPAAEPSSAVTVESWYDAGIRLDDDDDVEVITPEVM